MIEDLEKLFNGEEIKQILEGDNPALFALRLKDKGVANIMNVKAMLMLLVDVSGLLAEERNIDDCTALQAFAMCLKESLKNMKIIDDAGECHCPDCEKERESSGIITELKGNGTVH